MGGNLTLIEHLVHMPFHKKNIILGYLMHSIYVVNFSFGFQHRGRGELLDKGGLILRYLKILHSLSIILAYFYV